METILVAEMRAGPIRMEAARFRKADGEWSHITFSSVFDNDLRGHMGQQEAVLFARFVQDTIAREALSLKQPTPEPPCP